MKERCVNNWKTSIIGLALLGIGTFLIINYFDKLTLINVAIAGILILFGVGFILSKDTTLDALNKLLSKAAEKAIK